jgi:hypothetical protein
MRSTAVIALVLSLSWPAFGEATDQSRPPALNQSVGQLPLDGMRHHQPSQAEVDEREDARFGAGRTQAGTSRSADLGSDRIRRRFLDACMARLQLDEPLGSERNHRRFCTCRLDALERSSTREDLDAVARNIEERNAAKVVISRLPAGADRSNQAAIDACMDQLSW